MLLKDLHLSSLTFAGVGEQDVLRLHLYEVRGQKCIDLIGVRVEVGIVRAIAITILVLAIINISLKTNLVYRLICLCEIMFQALIGILLWIFMIQARLGSLLVLLDYHILLLLEHLIELRNFDLQILEQMRLPRPLSQ